VSKFADFAKVCVLPAILDLPDSVSYRPVLTVMGWRISPFTHRSEALVQSDALDPTIDPIYAWIPEDELELAPGEAAATGIVQAFADSDGIRPDDGLSDAARAAFARAEWDAAQGAA
jgi:hypothetical protein